jgi:hypothetical protein
VVVRGDGFDEGANAFREMPPHPHPWWPSRRIQRRSRGTTSTWAGEEHRVIRLDAIILSFPLE